MPWTKEIFFPVERVGVDTIQLILIFNFSGNGNNQVLDAEEYNLRVITYGEREASYDFEDAFMVPGSTSMVIGDPLGYLDQLLFGTSPTVQALDKKVKVIKKINGSNKFIGFFLEDTIEYDAGSRTLKFTAAPQLDILNKRMVYDTSQPQGDAQVLNPMNYNFFQVYNLVTVLEDIFKLVNPDISYSNGSLEIIHDWRFKGLRYLSPNEDGYLDDIEFHELQSAVRSLYKDQLYGISNVGDVLKKLALDYCAFIGMLSQDKAFFKKLFHWNEDNTQEVIVYRWIKGYRYGLIDYVKVNNSYIDVLGNPWIDPEEPYEAGTFTELEDRFLLLNSIQVFFLSQSGRGSNIWNENLSRPGYFQFERGQSVSPPSYGDIYSNNGSLFEVRGTPASGFTTTKIIAKRISGTNNPESAGTLVKVSGSGQDIYTYSSSGSADGHYTIYQVSDPAVLSGEFLSHGQMAAEFWYSKRGNMNNCRVDKFTFLGIDYDFLKDFSYEGFHFQPINMKHKDAEGITEVEAIFLGDH
jgi:hypothetical protein